MEAITLENKYYRYVMALKADGQLCHVMFVPKKTVSEKNPTDGMNAAEGALFSVNGPLKTENPFPYEVFVNLNFEGLTLPHGNRYAYTQATQRARFRGMKTDKLLNGTDHIITLEDPETKALFHLHYEIYDNSPALRRYTVIENRSEKELTVSSWKMVLATMGNTNGKQIKCGIA